MQPDWFVVSVKARLFPEDGALFAQLDDHSVAAASTWSNTDFGLFRIDGTSQSDHGDSVVHKVLDGGTIFTVHIQVFKLQGVRRYADVEALKNCTMKMLWSENSVQKCIRFEL